MWRKSWIVVGLGLLVGAACASWVASRSSGPDLSTGGRARRAVADRRFDEARELLARWAEEDPREGEPDYWRARLEVAADRPVEALDAMRRAIDRGHPEGPILVLRAVLLARAGKLDQAEPELKRAFADRDEPRAEVAEGLARVYLKTFRIAEAGQVLASWMKDVPDDPRPYLLRNEVDERLNADKAVVIGNFREALRRDPKLNGARLALAEKLQDSGRIDEAEAEFADLLRLDPKNLKALVGAGQIALLKGELADATRDFEAALALDPREKAALRELGLIDLNSGNPERACELLAVAVEVDPHDPEVRYTYSRALQAAGQGARAAEEAATTDRLKKEEQYVFDLRQKLVERPDDVGLRSEAAKFLIEHGHEKEGLEWTELILRRRPGHPPTCRLLAEYHASHGNPGLANYYRMAASEAAPGK